MLDIEEPVEYENIITNMEFHSHRPYASSNYSNNDEIRIPISQQDIITAPYESSIYVIGTVSGKKGANEVDVKLVNNAASFLFEEIFWEIGGVEVDRTKNVGITSTLKNILSIRDEEKRNLENACWFGPGETKKCKQFSFSIPLRLWLGSGEDYKKIILNVRQELVLRRSATDLNALFCEEDGATCDLTITNIYWLVPHISVSDSHRLKLLRMVEKDIPVGISFRSWELYEYPQLPETTLQSWTIKTSSQLEKPRFVVVAFQTDRKNQLKKDMSCFDACGVKNIKLFLNSQCYPYEKQNGDMTIFYEMFSRFQNSYYGQTSSWPAVTLNEFKTKTPIYVINCNFQNDMIKSGSIDIRLEFETADNFSPKTSAYCLLLHDSIFEYTLLTGSVKKVV